MRLFIKILGANFTSLYVTGISGANLAVPYWLLFVC